MNLELAPTAASPCSDGLPACPEIVLACCYCHQVRARDLSWQALPEALPAAARVSHGICPACWQVVVAEYGCDLPCVLAA